MYNVFIECKHRRTHVWELVTSQVVYTLLISILLILPSSLKLRKEATLQLMNMTVTAPLMTTCSPSRTGSCHLPVGFTALRYLAKASLPSWVPSFWLTRTMSSATSERTVSLSSARRALMYCEASATLSTMFVEVGRGLCCVGVLNPR